MIFPQPPEPYDQQLANRYRLQTLTLIDAAMREDQQEMNILFDQREQTLTELETLPILGEKSLRLMNEAFSLNERLIETLATQQSSISGELLEIYRANRGAGGYKKGHFPTQPSGGSFEQTG